MVTLVRTDTPPERISVHSSRPRRGLAPSQRKARQDSLASEQVAETPKLVQDFRVLKTRRVARLWQWFSGGVSGWLSVAGEAQTRMCSAQTSTHLGSALSSSFKRYIGCTSHLPGYKSVLCAFVFLERGKTHFSHTSQILAPSHKCLNFKQRTVHTEGKKIMDNVLVCYVLNQRIVYCPEFQTPTNRER